MDGPHHAVARRRHPEDPLDRTRVPFRFCRMRDNIAHALSASAVPRVHAFVATVAAPFVANVATAARIDVSMSEGIADVSAMLARTDAALINLGMLTEARMRAIETAVASNVPFVLDPVKVDRSPERLAFARRLVEAGPAIVKGNAAEMAALGELDDKVVAVTTGPRDEISVGRRKVAVASGTPRLGEVVATGCAAGVLMAGVLGRGADPLTAALSGAGAMALAGEDAARTSTGPGTFAAHLLDALAAHRAERVAARVSLVRPPADVSLYLVMGPDVPDPEALARAAVRGGVTLIQWRDKTGGARAQLDAVARLAAAVPVPILINDRADVARLGETDGLHVGEADAPASAVRNLLGAEPFLGQTVQTEAHLEGVDVCDYASIGGVFETRSKTNPRPPIGLDGFARLSNAVRSRADIAVCAIAGIDAERAHALAKAGADGIAVMSAITQADDPETAARHLRTAFQEGRP